jgi:F-type H+-transporting ATPase subunit b
MPQIAQLAETYSSQLFWLLIIFGLVFLVVGRGMVPKVMDTVAMRDNQIAEDLAAAQSARDLADEQEEAWRKRENENRATAQSLIGAAKAQAAVQAEQKLVAAQKRLDETLVGAEQRIAAARAAAAAEVESIAADAAQDIARRVAGIDVARPSAEAAVKKVLAHG